MRSQTCFDLIFPVKFAYWKFLFDSVGSFIRGNRCVLSGPLSTSRTEGSPTEEEVLRLEKVDHRDRGVFSQQSSGLRTKG